MDALQTSYKQTEFKIKEPKNLSNRIQWLRDYFFEGVKRPWRNNFLSFTTGTAWDLQYNEALYYIVPEAFFLLPTMKGSFRMSARKVKLDPNFWNWSLAERRAWVNKEVIVNYVPLEMLAGDLLAWFRVYLMTALCLNKKAGQQYEKPSSGKNGA